MNTESNNDQKLRDVIERASNGDDSAFSEVYSHLSKRVFIFLLSRVKDREVAKDLLQDIFVDVWNGLESFSYRSDSEFYGFVFLVARRKIAKYWKKHEKIEEIDISELLDWHPDLQESTEMNKMETKEVVIQILSTLNDKTRTVVELRYFGGLSFREIGIMIDSSEEAVRVLHHRALRKLEVEAKKYE